MPVGPPRRARTPRSSRGRGLPARRAIRCPRCAPRSPACHGCTLYREATQAVFGEGQRDARVMLIGEVPGDSEDSRASRSSARRASCSTRRSRPRASRAATPTSPTRSSTSSSPARGKRRIHDKPTRYEITACKPWLAAELEVDRIRDRRAARRDRGAGAARAVVPRDEGARPGARDRLARGRSRPCTRRRCCARPIRSCDTPRARSSFATCPSSAHIFTNSILASALECQNFVTASGACGYALRGRRLA